MFGVISDLSFRPLIIWTYRSDVTVMEYPFSYSKQQGPITPKYPLAYYTVNFSAVQWFPMHFVKVCCSILKALFIYIFTHDIGLQELAAKITRFTLRLAILDFCRAACLSPREKFFRH